MPVSEILTYLFGSVLITAFTAVVAIITNAFNLKDRFITWLDSRKKKQYKIGYKEGNPDFIFTFNYVSNTEPGKCILTATVLNISKEVKFIDSISYKFEFLHNKTKLEPPLVVMDGERWPKRLEHGERFYVSFQFHHTLNNYLYQYWQQGVLIYATCKSSTEDLIRSNTLEFDTLVKFVKPLDEECKKLSVLLSKAKEVSQRDIEATLWQLQIFGRITVHIARQLHESHIPIIQYLITHHGLVLKDDLWYHWYGDLEEKRISSDIIIDFLRSLVRV